MNPDLMTPIARFTPPPERGIFCNRTLNLRAISAIGYDMDYTLIHYRISEWERCAYEHVKRRLADYHWPVADLAFDPDFMIRGLIIDAEFGNLLKANRFGYVKRAYHGTRPLDFETQRDAYARTVISLADPRFIFMNTLFSVSEACIYAQLVDLLDRGELPGGPAAMRYSELYRTIRTNLNETHIEGELKDEIIADPDRFVELDAETALALLDQREAGKKLLVITNSDWYYTRAMMRYSFDRYLPSGMSWRDLFDVIIVSARKPHFFTDREPLYELASEEGLLKPARHLHEQAVFVGGHAGLVEDYLGRAGADILYVGDHIYTDVNVARNLRRWRTALVLRELEDEMIAFVRTQGEQAQLEALMAEKEHTEHQVSVLRLQLQRQRRGYGPPVEESPAEIEAQLAPLRAELRHLDEQIGPLAVAVGELVNARWGPLLRAGNDKSHLARQVERYADIYMSRVSNFLYQTPFAFLRSPRGSLPHDLGSIRSGQLAAIDQGLNVENRDGAITVENRDEGAVNKQSGTKSGLSTSNVKPTSPTRAGRRSEAARRRQSGST